MDVGDVLAGRYELRAVLGEGGMGKVLRAHDRELGRDVAVKVLAAHLRGDEQAIARLRTEARLAASVRHPHVVQVLDVLLDDVDAPALVMEHVDGPTLAEVVPEGGFADVDDALDVVADVAEALGAAHRVGLVHRDVSPRNVLLDRGVPRLTDFGIARPATADATATVVGAAGYLAPELVLGREADHRADVYGLACLATTLLTGRPPFEGEDAIAVAAQHRSAPPPDLRERRPDIPEDVAAAVLRGLAKDPDQRTVTVGALAAELGRPRTIPGPADPHATTTVIPPRALDGTAVLTGAGGGGAVADGATRAQGRDATPPPDEHATRLLHTSGADGGDRPVAGGHRRAVVVVAAAALLLAVALVLALAGRADAPPAATPSPDAPASPAPTATPTTTPTTPTTPPPSPSPSPPPTDARSAALAAILQVRELAVDLQADIDDERSSKLDEALSKVRDAVLEDDPRKAADELRAARREVTRPGRGELDDDVAEALLRQLLEVERAIDELELAT